MKKTKEHREFEFNLKTKCLELLPISTERLRRLLLRKSLAPQHVTRIHELLADRAYGKPRQEITGAGGGPLAVTFQQILKDIDGSSHETLS